MLQEKPKWDTVLVAFTSQILHSWSQSEMTAIIDLMLAISGKDTAKVNQPVVKDPMAPGIMTRAATVHLTLTK